MKLLIKYPTRSRPWEFIKTLNLYYSMLSGKHDVQIIMSADINDPTMRLPEVIRAANDCKAIIYYGENKNKIQACNADVEKANEWDVLLLASDDMIPQLQGYDDIIATEFEKHFPDYDGALFFNDGTGASKRNLCTLNIEGRKYYDRFGYVYNPEYKSVYCDNEYTHVGQMLNKLPLIDTVIIKHEHHAWGGSFPNDALYKRNDGSWKNDEQTFVQRKRMNFDLSGEYKLIDSNADPAIVAEQKEALNETAIQNTSDSKILLSILIPTILGRETEFNILYHNLEKQISETYSDVVKIISLKDNKEMSIGMKRNNLYSMANGRYSIQIDDDDMISDDFIETVLKAIELNPTHVSYLEQCTMDGEIKIACHSNRFTDWGNNIEGYDYARTIFYKDVIRTDIARQIKFKDIRYAEDHLFARTLKGSGLLKHEVFINKIMYFYHHESKTNLEYQKRYGIK